VTEGRAETLLLFAPGAGAPSTSPWMRAWAARLAALGAVEPLDYPYRLEGRRLPDPLPRLVEAHRAALAAARARRPGARAVLVGKSMGGRVGCHVSLEEPVAGVVCFGYPLRGAGKRAKLRDEVLRAMTAPVLFVQGTRDPLCPLDLLAAAREGMPARSELHVVEGGDHSLLVARRPCAAQEAADAAVLEAVATFIGGL
jgi:predicted alpha/beta-hydrolase family hydrolase